MSEKMLVTQALDERDLLVKKIADKIAKASLPRQALLIPLSRMRIRFLQSESAKKNMPKKQSQLISRLQI